MKLYAKTTNKGSASEQGLIIDENTGRTVAVTFDPKDAPVLAAGPELLQALQILLDALTRGSDTIAVQVAKKNARAAIEKATTQE